MKTYPTDQQLRDASRSIGEAIIVAVSMLILLTAVVSGLYLLTAPFFGQYDSCFGEQVATGRLMAILFVIATPVACFAVPLAKRIIELR